MKKLISYFIKYHVAVNVFLLAFLAFGIIGIRGLKSSFFPLIESKIVNISIVYPGASPQEIEEGVVLKIEDNLKGLKGVDRITSTSKENSGLITVEIKKDENIDFMLLEIKNAVDRVPSFPIGMEPLIVAKREEVRQTISFALSGKEVSLFTLKAIARQVENDLRAIDGISQIDIKGYPEEEIEIAVNQERLLAFNLTFNDIATAVSGTNILATGGNIKTNTEAFLIRANNRAYYGRELSNIVVKASQNGKVVRLKDVATIKDRFSETPNATFFNKELAVNITVTSTNNEDLISAATKVKAYIKDYNDSHNNIHISVVKDLSITLEQRTQLLAENAIVGIILVLIFLSLFLNIRLAFWVALGLPVSFLGMFIFAGHFDVTINVLSLFGMIIVIGILVDDGIVIAENIYQHYEKGKSPKQAAIDGTLEVIPPVVSAIITTLLAFSLFLFLDSRIGDFFSEVSVVVILTLVVSLIEALVILPAHLAHSKALMQNNEATTGSKIKQFFSKMRVLNRLGDTFMAFLRDKIYSPILHIVLKYKVFSFGVFLGLLIITFGSIGGGIIRVTLFPSIASDTVSITLDMPNGTDVKITDSIISMIEDKSYKVNKELTNTYLKGTNRVLFENTILQLNSESSAKLIINMLPGEERPDAINARLVANKLRKAVGPVVGVDRLIFGSGGNFGGSPVSVSLLSNNIKELKAAKLELKETLKTNPLLKDIEDNDPAGIKEIRLELKESAYLLGLNLRDVMRQIRAGFFGVQAQRFQRGQDEIKVWVRYNKDNRASINNLDAMRIVTPSGQRVTIKDVASYTIARGDVSINHLEGQREIRVSADLKDPSTSATDILSRLKQEVIPSIQSKYPTITASFEGQNREASKLSSSLARSGIPILLLIYITIAFTFRSYSQPILLLLLIPFSLTAVAWGHWLLGFPVNVLSLLGIVALVGIMVNDGLVLIGRFNTNLKEGLTFNKALLEAGKSRFRAIFLTSLTTIAGLAPLLLEKSRQAQFLKPMAISISFGIAYATILTLLVLPLFLSFSNSIKKNVKWLITGKKITKEEVERAIIEQKENYED